MLEHQYSKAMHAECKEKKRKENIHIYPGEKQAAEESPRPYLRHYPSLQSSSDSLTTPYTKVYSRPSELGDIYGGANMPRKIMRRPSNPACPVHVT